MPEDIHPQSGSKTKFIVGGLLIVVSIIYLIASSTSKSSQYFLTVEETLEKSASGELDERNLRISGAVIGDSIQYDSATLKLAFTMAHIPGDKKLLETEGGLAAALHNAVSDPKRPRLPVVYEGPMPDLLQNEAQAIVTGQLDENGVFQAEELLLKCPTKYEEVLPDQTE